MNPPQVYMCSPSWTLLPPPSPFHPPGSSQCTSPKHPASCTEPGLATHFIHDILHVSMPFSQIFPPSPSPTDSIRLFFTSPGLQPARFLHSWDSPGKNTSGLLCPPPFSDVQGVNKWSFLEMIPFYWVSDNIHLWRHSGHSALNQGWCNDLQ